MRLFYALELAAPVVDAIGAGIDELRARGRHRAIAWENREKLHLTLRFLGEVDEARAGQLVEEGRAIARATAPFTLAFGGLDTFRDTFRGEEIPRVVFVAVAEPNEALHALAARFGHDARGYHPHVTIARVRRQGAEAVLTALAEAPPLVVPSMVVTSLTLMETRGGRYLPRERFVLGGGSVLLRGVGVEGEE